MPRALVTGAAGFVGSNLVDSLVGAGYEVRAADVAAPSGDGADAEHLHLDVRDRDAVRRAAAGCDVVVDNAALVPVSRSSQAEFLSVNAEGCRNVLEAARDEGAYAVHISSSAIYGVPSELPVRESTPLRPFEPYGISKAAGEGVADELRAAGLPVASLRARAILGRGRLGLFELIFRRIRAGRAVPMFGKGETRIQMCAAEDFCAAALAAIERRASGSYNIGSAGFGTVREDLGALIAHAGTDARLRPVPLPLVRGGLRTLGLLRLSPFTEWHVIASATDYWCDTSHAEADLGWRPTRTNIDALRRAYDRWLEAPEEFGSSPHRRPLRGALPRVLRGR